MGKKKNARAVIVTIIITLIVLAGLSYAGIKYLLPIYTQGQNGLEDSMADIYRFAVRLFPLLVGIVLIIIASMIAGSRDDDEDEDDKLPPNSYDNQLFEEPADDPSSKRSSARKSVPEFTEEEEQQFVSIFDAPAAEPVVEPIEDTPFEGESPVEESVADKPVVEEASKSSEKEDALITSIYSLVKKLDDLTEMSSDDVEFDEEDLEEDDEDFNELDSVETPVQCTANCNISALENKVNDLCDMVNNLSQLVANNMTVVSTPAEEPEVEEATVEEPEVVEEELPMEEAVEEIDETSVESVEETVEEIVEEPVENTVEEASTEEQPTEEVSAEESESSEAVKFANIEFGSAQEAGYDISFVITDASLDTVVLNLAGLGDAFEVNGKTFIVVPFLSNDEIKSELDKLDAPYELKTIAGGEKADFEEVIGSKIR